MNLAQLIDPAWVCDGFPERSAPIARQHELKAPPEVAGGERPGIAAAIRTVLDFNGRGRKALSVAEIHEVLPEFSSLQVASNVGWLFQSGDLAREGKPLAYRYWLTQRGRARLEG